MATMTMTTGAVPVDFDWGVGEILRKAPPAADAGVRRLVPLGRVVRTIGTDGSAGYITTLGFFDPASGLCFGGAQVDEQLPVPAPVAAHGCIDTYGWSENRGPLEVRARSHEPDPICTELQVMKEGFWARLSDEAVARYAAMPAYPIGALQDGPAWLISDAPYSAAPALHEVQKHPFADAHYDHAMIVTDLHLKQWGLGNVIRGMQGSPIIQGGRLVGTLGAGGSVNSIACFGVFNVTRILALCGEGGGAGV